MYVGKAREAADDRNSLGRGAAVRVAHVISNVRLGENAKRWMTAKQLPVSSGSSCIAIRLETETDFLVGRREDLVRRENGELKIAERKILIEQSVLMAKNLTVFL